MENNIKNFLPPSKLSKYKQCYYTPVNPQKYIGDIHKIICRSSWETKFCRYLDVNSDVVEWSSEPFSIKYFYKADQQIHRYFPDFYFMIEKNGEKIRYIVEVKPSKDLIAPVVPKRKTDKAMKNYIYQLKAFTKNYDKAQSIKKWCSDNGYKFVYLTEHSKLF